MVAIQIGMKISNILHCKIKCVTVNLGVKLDAVAGKALLLV